MAEAKEFNIWVVPGHRDIGGFTLRTMPKMSPELTAEFDDERHDERFKDNHPLVRFSLRGRESRIESDPEQSIIGYSKLPPTIDGEFLLAHATGIIEAAGHHVRAIREIQAVEAQSVPAQVALLHNRY